MHRRVRRRYIVERWFRVLGFAAVALSVLFLAFLLFNMGSKGLGGFSRYEAALPIDFTRSDLFLDPAALRGARRRADGRFRRPRKRDLQGRERGLWSGRRARCSAMRASLG